MEQIGRVLVEGLNIYFEQNKSESVRGWFVYDLQINPNEVFPAYKEYEIIIWYISPKEHIKERFLTVQKCDRVITDPQKENILKELGSLLVSNLLNKNSQDLLHKILIGEIWKK